MIVPDLDLIGIVLVPNDADAVWIVDANTVLSFAVTVQFLQTVAGRIANLALFLSSRFSPSSYPQKLGSHVVVITRLITSRVNTRARPASVDP